jgi:ATP-binding cassette, subfamily B, bacterial
MSSEVDERPAKRLSKLRLIWNFASAYPAQIAAALAALIVAATSTLAIPRVFKEVVDKGFGAETSSSIAPYFYSMLGIVAVLAVATAFRFYFVSWLGERVVADLRRSVQGHLLTLDPSFFEENRPSEIASRLTSDTAVIEQVVAISFSIALRNLFMGVGGLIYLFTLSAKLTGLMLLVIPLTIVPISVMGRRVRNLSRASQDSIAGVGAMVSEMLGAIRIVQAFTQEPREARRFGDTVERAFATARRRFRMRAAMTALVIALIFSAITLVLWEGARDVISGGMTGGTIAAFILTAVIVAGAFGALTEVYGDVMRGAGAAGRMAELLQAQPEIQPPANP